MRRGGRVEEAGCWKRVKWPALPHWLGAATSQAKSHRNRRSDNGDHVSAI